MFEEIKKELSSVKLLSLLLTIAVGIYLLQFIWQFLRYFSDVFVILVVAWLFSFILEPLVDRIYFGFKVSKTTAAILTYILIAAGLGLVVFLFIPTITDQFNTLSQIIPRYIEKSPPFVERWSENALNSLSNYLSFIPSVAGFLFSIIVVLLISFYLIVDREKINREIFSLIPKNLHKDFRLVEKIVNETFASFVRVQIIFAILSGVGTWLVLVLFGVGFASSTALISGVLTIVPLVGPVFAIIPPIIISLITDPAKAVLVFLVLLLYQQIIFNIWGPRFLGRTFKIHPIIVLLSFIVGYKIGGLVGAIFAIPIISILILVIHDLGHRIVSPE